MSKFQGHTMIELPKHIIDELARLNGGKRPRVLGAINDDDSSSVFVEENSVDLIPCTSEEFNNLMHDPVTTVILNTGCGRLPGEPTTRCRRYYYTSNSPLCWFFTPEQPCTTRCTVVNCGTPRGAGPDDK